MIFGSISGVNTSSAKLAVVLVKGSLAQHEEGCNLPRDGLVDAARFSTDDAFSKVSEFSQATGCENVLIKIKADLRSIPKP